MTPPGRFWFDRDDVPDRGNIRFVLIGTTEPGNIGAAARALKSMGFYRLVLVDPIEPWQTDHAIAMSHGAEEVLANAEVYNNLTDAIADCTWVVGTTRRDRRDKTKVITPSDWSGLLSDLGSNEEIAILFGPEKTGLSNEDILRCRRIITAPSPVEYPSLNLAQSVMLLSYESSRGLRLKPSEPGSPILATDGEMERMYEHLDRALRVNKLEDKKRRRLLRHLRIILHRAEMRRDDVLSFHTIARRIHGPVPRTERGKDEVDE